VVLGFFFTEGTIASTFHALGSHGDKPEIGEGQLFNWGDVT
jgi:hypothetical protein